MTHNIPLLREVITHPRFVSGKISTKFLAEEFPKGFSGHVLTPEERRQLVALSGWMYAQRDIRNRSFIGRDVVLPKSWNLVVGVDTQPEPVTVRLTDDADFYVIILFD